ncbi:MAG: oligopeptide/dipeptide ABC transporter ATP-binding protein [Candidatus Bathyarchaeia archaeon]
MRWLSNLSPTLISTSQLTKYFLASKHGLLESVARKPASYVKAVDHIDMEIAEHEILALVGESGSGKTTLGLLLCTLEHPTEGSFAFMDQKIDKSSEAKVRRQAQMVFQNPSESLDPRMNVRAIVMEALQKFKLSKAEKEQRFEDSLRAVGLDPHEFSSRRPGGLSGGQKQRIAIARAIASNPKFVILDEPTSALDASIQAQVLNLLIDLHEKFGFTYLLITHNIAVARFISDRTAVMYAGKLIELGSTDEIITNPKHPYTQALLKSVPTLEIRGLEAPTGETPSLLHPPSGCRYHPRCPYVMDICKTTDPELIQAESSSVACWLYSKLKS